MIDKLDLVSIISKYHLSGLVDATRWEIKDNSLNIDFMSPSKELLGKLEVKDFPLEDSTIAIGNTKELNKLISITNGYINLEYEKDHKLPVKLVLSDNQYTLNYSLTGLNHIPKAATLKDEYPFTERVTIDNESILAIVKAKQALTETNTVVISSNPNDDGDDRMELCFGGNIADQSKVSFYLSDVEAMSDEFKQLEKQDYLYYNSNIIKEIMYANKDMPSGKMGIFIGGIMKLEFEDEKIKSTYYLVDNEK
jgi:hypothetical protein